MSDSIKIKESDKFETIEVSIENDNLSCKWSPVLGAETNDLLNNLNLTKDIKQVVLNESVKILSKFNSPESGTGSDTGLAVGYIQSGKTMSFTTVTTLARDNKYQLIIVIAGTTTSLFKQSVNRLRRDLRINNREDRPWILFENPKPKEKRVSAIKNTLIDWQDKNISNDDRQTVLIMVMKNHLHLKNLIKVLNNIGLEWINVPTLLIDDEADQASLNGKINKDEETTTYRCIKEMREILPAHSYLQYTATPQGPLLINIINILSPDFAEVLTPGSEYVGGREFFIDSSNLIVKIPQNEITQDISEGPPDTLKKAMSIFLLGVAAGRILKGQERNRSMMVHPSIRTLRHNQFFIWVTQIKNNWEKVLNLNNDDPDKHELISEFLESYDDLSKTVDELPTFQKLIEILPSAIRKTVVEEINARSGKTPEIDWSGSYAYILVGGQAMDRGFTVEGLTVTYMPRGVGVGNADTVQQRARFFGYKKKYLGYCRIYIDNTTMQAYKDYVEHEEDIRRQLRELSIAGKSLIDWKRSFLMPRQLRPTRNNIIDLDYTQDNLSDEWFYPRAPHDTLQGVLGNRVVVDRFLSKLSLNQDIGHEKRTEIMRHGMEDNLSLKFVQENLLVKFRTSRPNDSHKFIGLLLQIRNYLERNPDETCSVYFMSYNTESNIWNSRDRSLNIKDEIKYIFQGKHPDKDGEIYPGDDNIGDHSRIIIQLHKLNIIKDGKTIADDVYNISIWIPEKMSKSWLVQ
jgi:hypothetical protein